MRGANFAGKMVILFSHLAIGLMLILTTAIAHAEYHPSYPFVVKNFGELPVYEKPDKGSKRVGLLSRENSFSYGKGEPKSFSKFISQKPKNGFLFYKHNNFLDGWIEREKFWLPGEIPPVKNWPFRYWVERRGSGQTGYDALENEIFAVETKHSREVVVIFHFTPDGFILNPKTGKKTKYRVYMLDETTIAYGPADPKLRNLGKMFNVGVFRPGLQAICSSSDEKRCLQEVVNLAPDWTGSKDFYGDSKAFARFRDPVEPLYVELDGKNPDCVADCPKYQPQQINMPNMLKIQIEDESAPKAR